MKAGWVAAAAAVFVVGIGLGVLGGVLLFDDDSSSTDGTAVPEVDCDEAQAVVDQSVAAIEEINQSETQDVSFFAAILVEQRTITFAMDTAPSCFSLQDRAGAVGLLDGIQALLDSAAASNATVQTPAVQAPTVLEPAEAPSTDPQTTDSPTTDPPTTEVP